MKQLFFFLLAISLSSSGFSQKLIKIKFKSDRGNIIYYTAQANSDVIHYCDLYFIPVGTDKASKINIVTKRIEEEDGFGDISTFCVPTKISLGGNVYRCEVSLDFKYFNLVDENGTRIRFKPID